MLHSHEIVAFDKVFREACFYAWYEAGTPKDIRSTVPTDKDGRKPTTDTLQRWRRDEGWIQRADALDAEMSVAIDKDVIEQKKQDYKMLAGKGRDLLLKGMAYLDKKGFDTAASAVRAVGLGGDMMAKYSRAADMVDAVFGKTDKQLTADINQLLGKDDDEDTIDVESTDAPSDTEKNDNS